MLRTRSRHRGLSIASALLATVAGCFFSESQDQVKDLRVLAIRTEPPEILYDYWHLLGGARPPGAPERTYALDVDALVVDPKGREIEVTFRLCPEDSVGACPGYHIRASAPAEQNAVMRQLVHPRAQAATADLLDGAEVAVAPAHYALSSTAMDYMVPHVPTSGRQSPTAVIMPALPSFVVRARARDGSQEEVAFHKFMLNADLAGALALPPLAPVVDGTLAALLGFGACTPQQEADADRAWTESLEADAGAVPPPPQCVRRRTVNHNPRIARVLYTFEQTGGFGPGGGGGGGGGGPGGFLNRRAQQNYVLEDPTQDGLFTDYTVPLTLRPGQSVTLRPVVAAADHEHYQRFAVDSITGAITAEEHDEDMAYAWFTTAGTTQQTTSDNNNPDADYTVGQDAPDGPAYVWLVVRDQRGGVTWRRLDFLVHEDREIRTGPLGPGRAR